MTDAERITAAKAEYTKQLKQIGNVSFSVWLLNRAEASEARAAQAEQERNAEAKLAVTCAEEVETLTNEKAQLQAERDDLRRQLREACNEVTDDVTRLQWLKSLIHESQKHIEVLSEGDLDAGYTCLREVQDLHDALKAMINGGES